MPLAQLKIKPGVNAEYTPALNTAGISGSSLIRHRFGLPEKIGGWLKYFAFAVSGVPKACHAWLDLNQGKWLAVGSTTALTVISSGSSQVITPQSLISDCVPNFETTASSALVSINDPNVGTVTTFDAVTLKTPVSIGGLILSGTYPITLSLGAGKYEITAASAATATRLNLAITGITKANPAVVAYTGADDLADGDVVYIFAVGGMTQVNGLIFTVAGLNTGANTFQLSGIDSTGYTTYTSGGFVTETIVPQFTTTSGSAIISVTFPGHGLLAGVGNTMNFPISTTVGGVTILGTYAVLSVSNVNVFTISATASASSSAVASMNSGNVEIAYSIAIGPPGASTGYGIGTYSSGGYGTGSATSAQTGSPITATDWTLDNWGRILLSCPDGGGIYQWEPNSGIQNAQLLTSAPAINTGMFISMQTQMLITYGAAAQQTIGIAQDPLLVAWSAQGDYTNFTPSVTSLAGSRRLSTGSRIVGGLSVPQQELLWTDIDLWSMQFLGTLAQGVWGFIKIGSSCGLIAKHAAARLGANVYWMSTSNFFLLGGGAPQPIPCSVWDVCFQDLNNAINPDTNLPYSATSWAWANTPFNEVFFYFPRASTGATTPDYYVKYNTLENLWDHGPLDRTCGIDQSILGMPISCTAPGIIYQHETSPNADGQPLTASFLTGLFKLADGDRMQFVDWFQPDFKWGTYGGSQTASIQITLYSYRYLSDTPRTYGPYTVTKNTPYFNPRVRGRWVQMLVQSSDLDSFWRLGGSLARIAPDGRF